MLSESELLAIIERSFFLMPMVPGRLMPTDLTGVTGRYCDIPHPFGNLVGLADLTETNADDAIATVRAFFAERQSPFAWAVGPVSQPANLPEKLARSGLIPVSEMAGLVLRDIATPFPHDPSVVVREVGPEAREDVARVSALGFDFPLPLCELFTDAYLGNGADLTVRSYLAYAPGSDMPGAFASSVYVPGTSVVQLAGAATLPEARGQGLYSALVARRLGDARADGMTTAIIQAVRDTSAPILRKRGFEEVCSLTLWAGGLPADEAPAH